MTAIRKSVTQSDIARALGVSQPTVGLVVGRAGGRGMEKLRPETVERIRRKAEEMGYRPHRAAQTMRQGKARVVGMISSGTVLQAASERAFYTARALKRRGYDLLKIDLHHQDNTGEIIDHFIESRVDGVVLACTWVAEYVGPLRQRKIPLVGLSGDEIPGVSLVRGDMRGGFYRLVEHLLEQGHRTMLQFSQTRNADRTQWRWQQALQAQGFREGLEAAGGCHAVGLLADYPAWISEGSGIRGMSLSAGKDILGASSRFDPYRWAVLLTKKLLETSAALPDVILCPNDDWAFGTANTLLRAGFSIPGDVAVTGFNASRLADTFFVPLTTVRQPVREMAEMAVEILIDEIEGRPHSAVTRDMPCELVPGKSSLAKAN